MSLSIKAQSASDSLTSLLLKRSYTWRDDFMSVSSLLILLGSLCSMRSPVLSYPVCSYGLYHRSGTLPVLTVTDSREESES